MSLMEDHALGDLIHAYTRARWRGDGQKQDADDLGARLGRSLRDRIDVLGLDAERLLTAAPAEALSRLEALEQEAMLEDSGANARAAKSRGSEETRQRNHAKPPLRGRRARPTTNREPTGVGRRRQPV